MQIWLKTKGKDIQKGKRKKEEAFKATENKLPNTKGKKKAREKQGRIHP